MNLYEASRQWAERPPDERFSSLPDMLNTCREYYTRACQARVPFNACALLRRPTAAKCTSWAAPDSKHV
jgi:hypothetical protein